MSEGHRNQSERTPSGQTGTIWTNYILYNVVSDYNPKYKRNIHESMLINNWIINREKRQIFLTQEFQIIFIDSAPSPTE